MGPFYFGFALGELNMALPTLNLMYGMDEMAISQDIAYGTYNFITNYNKKHKYSPYPVSNIISIRTFIKYKIIILLCI